MKLTELFEQIEDRRVDRCKKHNLVDILMICFIGFLTGHKSIENIQFHAELNKKFLRKYLKLENGIPSPDTILRVFARKDTKQLEKVPKKLHINGNFNFRLMCNFRSRKRTLSISEFCGAKLGIKLNGDILDI